jgi:hypothetical protein
MERYQSHTEHCRACSGALGTIRRVRPWLAVVPWLALLATVLSPTVWVVVAAASLALVAWQCGQMLKRWERLLLQGQGHPPRNRS